MHALHTSDGAVNRIVVGHGCPNSLLIQPRPMSRQRLKSLSSLVGAILRHSMVQSTALALAPSFSIVSILSQPGLDFL